MEVTIGTINRKEKELDLQKKASRIVELALDKKAEYPVVIDISRLSAISDYLILLSGTSARHVQTISKAIRENLKKRRLSPLSTEGVNEGHWVVLDYDDIIVHIFHEPVREYYDLDGLWAEAPRVELEVMREPAGISDKAR